jgi:hypothetical protein
MLLRSLKHISAILIPDMNVKMNSSPNSGISISQKETVVYPDFGHEELPGFQDIALQFLMNL